MCGRVSTWRRGSPRGGRKIAHEQPRRAEAELVVPVVRQRALQLLLRQGAGTVDVAARAHVAREIGGVGGAGAAEWRSARLAYIARKMSAADMAAMVLRGGRESHNAVEN